jgi:hypothetical protein
VLHLIILRFAFLVVRAGLIYALTTPTNFNIGPHVVLSLVIVIYIKDINVFDIASGRVYISCDVVFDETMFSFADLNPTAGHTSEILLLPTPSPAPETTDLPMANIHTQSSLFPPCLWANDLVQPQRLLDSVSVPVPRVRLEVDSIPKSAAAYPTTSTDDVIPAPHPTPLRRIAPAGSNLAPEPSTVSGSTPTQTTVPVNSTSPSVVVALGPSLAPASTASDLIPAALPLAPEPLAASTSVPTPSRAPRTRLQDGIRKPKVYSDGTVRYRNLTISEEPCDLTTTMSDPNWKAAMDLKFSALVHNNTWHLVPPQKDRNLIDCKCVYKIK